MNIRLTIHGLEDMQKSLDAKNILEIVKEEMGKEANFLAERIDANAPILDGDLRKNLDHSDPIVTGRSVDVTFGVIDPSFEAQAIRLHEEPFKLGPVSRLQPSTPEGGIGHKFMARVFNFHSERLLQRIVDSITSTLQKGYQNARGNSFRNKESKN